jgi:branched-chain amino acid transport system ATP-binding protein
MLDVVELVSGYGEVDVLRGLTVSFPGDQLTTIIGANGAGKSTFLKTVFGMLSPRGGRIRFKDVDITHWPSKKVLDQGIGYVPQGRCNFPAMSVEDNLLVSLDHRRNGPGGKARADLEALYVEFPVLAEKRRTLAGNLSGGQQQILEMGMALLQQPELLLVDEPSLGLSPAMLDQVFAKILDIKSTRRIAVVMVEQNAKQALAISDRGIVLELGRLRMEGPATELLANVGVRQVYLGG